MQTSSAIVQEVSPVDSATSYSLDEKVGEGHYRIVYRHGDLALKVLKPYRTKDYGLLRIDFPTWLYAALKFGVTDLNMSEYRNYLSLIKEVPQELINSFAKIFGVIHSKQGSTSLCELISNADGSLSQPLEQYGTMRDSRFWVRIDKLEEFFLSRGIPNFNINGGNIVVRELGDGHIIPVLIEYKRIGARTYPLQLHLLLKSEAVKRVKRKFSSLREKYQPKTPSET